LIFGITAQFITNRPHRFASGSKLALTESVYSLQVSRAIACKGGGNQPVS
jgi:hypothetical protein